MPNTFEADLQRLLRLPWTIVREVTPEGEVLLRVKEIPSAVGSGGTPEELAADLWESLTESLRTYLHFGDKVPLPQGVSDSFVRLSPKASVPKVPFFVSPVISQTGTTSALA